MNWRVGWQIFGLAVQFVFPDDGFCRSTVPHAGRFHGVWL